MASYQVGLVAESAIDEIPMALIRKVDVDRCEMALNLLLRNLLKRFDKLNNKFEEYEIPMIMDGILKQYYYLTIEELAYVFNKGITGAYVMPYNKLDSSVVFDWIHRYDSRERIAIAERRDAKKKGEQRKLEEATFKGVSKEIAQSFIKKISGQNNLDADKKKEEEYQKFRQQYLASRKQIE